MPKGEVFRTTIVKNLFLIKCVIYKHHLETKTKLHLLKKGKCIVALSGVLVPNNNTKFALAILKTHSQKHFTLGP